MACCNDDHCAVPESLNGPQWRRALWIALAVNGGFFLAEIIAGLAAGSSALQADALDFGCGKLLQRGPHSRTWKTAKNDLGFFHAIVHVDARGAVESVRCGINPRRYSLCRRKIVVLDGLE